jgi:hypothetical protein
VAGIGSVRSDSAVFGGPSTAPPAECNLCVSIVMVGEALSSTTFSQQAVGARWFHNAGGMSPFDLKFQHSGRYLSFAEREEIALLKAQDKGVREIARAIGRDPGTISRELRRNAATRSGKLQYRASVAQ